MSVFLDVSLHLCTRLSVYLSALSQSIGSSVCPSVHLSVCPSVHLSICLSPVNKNVRKSIVQHKNHCVEGLLPQNSQNSLLSKTPTTKFSLLNSHPRTNTPGPLPRTTASGLSPRTLTLGFSPQDSRPRTPTLRIHSQDSSCRTLVPGLQPQDSRLRMRKHCWPTWPC